MLRDPFPSTASQRQTILVNITLHAPKPRVLVVDDNADAADTLASLLAIFDCTVNVAYSGDEALVLGDVIRPQLVILDIAMPRMGGCETAQRIRQRPWGQQARIAALTAWGDEETRASTKRAGVDVHLTKPIDVDLLVGVLAQL